MCAPSLRRLWALACLFLVAGSVAHAGPPVLTFDPWLAIEPGSNRAGPSFLSLTVGKAAYRDVAAALGRRTRVDGDISIWRGTETARRYDLVAIVVHFGPRDVADWMELVLSQPERVDTVTAAMRLGQATGIRREGRKLVQHYGATGVELVVENGRVGTLRLVGRVPQVPPATVPPQQPLLGPALVEQPDNGAGMPGGLFPAQDISPLFTAEESNSLFPPEGTSQRPPARPAPELLAAASRGDLAEVGRQIEAGADVRAVGPRGRIALHLAALEGHVEVAEALIDAAFGRDERGRPIPLEDMLDFNKYDDATSAVVNARDGDGSTPLHLAAGAGHFDLVRLLLERGAKVDAADKEGRTPLHRAAMAGDDAAVAMLLSHQADPRARDKSGRTPLEVATGDAVRRRIARVVGKPEPDRPPPFQPVPVVPGPIGKTPPGGRRSEEAEVAPIAIGPIEFRDGNAIAPLDCGTGAGLSEGRVHESVIAAIEKAADRFPDAQSVHVRLIVEGTELYRLEGNRSRLLEQLRAGTSPPEILATMQVVEVIPWHDLLKAAVREAEFAGEKELSPPSR